MNEKFLFCFLRNVGEVEKSEAFVFSISIIKEIALHFLVLVYPFYGKQTFSLFKYNILYYPAIWANSVMQFIYYISNEECTNTVKEQNSFNSQDLVSLASLILMAIFW